MTSIDPPQQPEDEAQPPTEVDPALTERQPASAAEPRARRFDSLSIVLVLVIVAALVGVGVLAAEMYGRSRAKDVIAATTQCVVQDGASASLGASPFLLQYLTDHFDDISITTLGNQVRNAKGMKAQIAIEDVRLEPTATSKGTIGALNVTINWSADGIKQTVESSIPLISPFVSGVATHASEGTIELEGLLGSITTKPQLGSDGIDLQVVGLEGLGFSLPREAVQPALTAFASELNDYPLGLRADSVQVTDTGVVAQFSARDVAIPKDDACFASL